MNLNDIFAGRYHLIRHLGTGGFAQVWLAEDQMAEDAVVAVKIYAPERGLDENGIKIFRREFALTVPLNHPHLLKAFHFDVYQGSPYLIMPFCREGSLMTRVVDQYRFSEKEIAEILNQLGDGLAYLHGKDICHQDVKPDNVLIMEPGQYVLSDFGISSKTKRTLAKSMRAEQANTYSAFTPAYAPPEKHTSKPTPSGDVFSLGVTLYELITHDVPYADIGMALKEGATVPDLPQGYSPELNRLIQSCLALDPEKRPTARELCDRAFSFLKKGKWPAPKTDAPSTPKRRRVTEKMPEPPSIEADSPKTSEDKEKDEPKGPEKQKKRNYWPIIAGFLIVAFWGGKAIMDLLKEREQSQVRSQFFMGHDANLQNAANLQDSIQVYHETIAKATESPYNEVISQGDLVFIKLRLSSAENRKKQLEEVARQSRRIQLKPLSEISPGTSNQDIRETNPEGNELYNSLTLNKQGSQTSGCNTLYLDIEKGTLNGLTPKATQAEVKSALPCFSKVVSPLQDAENAEVFFEKQQFNFKTASHGIEVYRYFTGKISLPLINKSEAQVIQLLGKQPVWKVGKVAGYEDYVFKADYGTLIVGFSASECTRIKVYHQIPLLVPSARNL